MVERYARDASREANDDIAEVVYGVSDEHVSVTCHREDSKISATTRHFAKPALTDDKGASGVVWNTDSYSAFLVYDTHARTHARTHSPTVAQSPGTLFLPTSTTLLTLVHSENDSRSCLPLTTVGAPRRVV